MKTKHLTGIAIIILLVSVCLLSCTDEKAKTEKALVGTWYVVGSNGEVGKAWEQFKSDHHFLMGVGMEVTSNGKWEIEVESQTMFCSNLEGEVKFKLNYVINGDTLILSGFNSGNDLVLVKSKK